MQSGSGKSDGEAGRAGDAVRARRRMLRDDLTLCSLFLLLLWAQYSARSWVSALAPAIVLGGVLGVSRSWKLPRALFATVATVILGVAGMRIVWPRETASEAMRILLDGAKTRRVELLLTVEGALERRSAGAARARVSVRSHGTELELLATFPELGWVGRGFIAVGDRLRVVGKAEAARAEGVASFAEFLLRRGIVGSIRVLHVDAIAWGESRLPLRERLTRALLLRHPLSDGFGILISGAFGLGDLLSEETTALFRETGLTHLLVVSGYHVGVLFAAVYAGAAGIVRLYPALTMLLPLPLFASAFAMLFGGGYVLFVGASLTTVRALLSAALVLLGKTTARRVSARRTLLIVAFLCAAGSPGSAFEAGYQLTFAALGGLYYGGAWLRMVSPDFKAAGLRKQLGDGLAASLGACAFTTPVMLCWFNTLSPCTLIFNLLAGALFSLLFILAAGVLFLIRACGVTAVDLLIAPLAQCGEWYLAALAWLASLVADSPLRYRELSAEWSMWLAAVNGLLVVAGIALAERQELARTPLSLEGTFRKEGVEKKRRLCDPPRPTTSN